VIFEEIWFDGTPVELGGFSEKKKAQFVRLMCRANCALLYYFEEGKGRKGLKRI
jgi:hypothetical protein